VQALRGTVAAYERAYGAGRPRSVAARLGVEGYLV
jgi:hypothetical protein